MRHRAGFFAVLLTLTSACLAAEPCNSGPKPGQRPGPYSALVSVGKDRGQPHCFICETEDRPAVIVFARALSDPLGKLARGMDRALVDHKDAGLRAWVTFLSEDQTALDPKVVEWSKKHALRNVPLAVFEDVVGPPSYLIARDAEVTGLLSVKQKVVRNFAFRAGELTNERIAEILKSVPQITESDKPKK
jgi:hypothetical protein